MSGKRFGPRLTSRSFFWQRGSNKKQPAQEIAPGDVRHAHRLVYATGLDLKDPSAATPIGAGCKVCDRENCAQRAFPAVGRDLQVDENLRRFAPYANAAQAGMASHAHPVRGHQPLGGGIEPARRRPLKTPRPR